jgi:RND family efflux transporter MFP subunit
MPESSDPTPHTDVPDEDGDRARRAQAMRKARIVAIVVLVVLAGGAVRTVVSRMSNARSLEAGTVERAKQYVKVTLPKSGGSTQNLSLPGTLQGYVQAPIAARSSGYLRRWTKDIGSKVEKGELLAEIETPEVDQQLSQAIAARAQAASSMDLAKSTVERWESLRAKDAVSQQELDERRSTYVQAKANLDAADANVERLRQLEGFKRVVAPFSGVITRRNVDVGDLIDAGSSSSSRPLFVLAQTDPLRVYVSVPQSYAQRVKPGQQVEVTQAELPGRTFKAEVARTSASIDTTTRTMQIEVTLANRDGVLLPGALVQVLLPLAGSSAMVIPTNALLFRGEGTRVAVVDASGRVELRPVRLGRDFGQTVEVLDGLSATDRLVLNPADSLTNGDQVTIAPQAKDTP